MQGLHRTRDAIVLGVLFLVPTGTSLAQQVKHDPSTMDTSLRLAHVQPKQSQETVREKTTVKTVETRSEAHTFREVSDFFNIREANANLEQGRWELEIRGGWSKGTESGEKGGGLGFFDGEGDDGDDDHAFTAATLKYGFTDDFYAEIGLAPITVGEGGEHGAGDTTLALFYQFVHETGAVPAMAVWAEGRFPTGDGSSGVDGELHLNFTKTFAERWRAHLGGFIETANGAPGGEDEENRRNFQWGLGPGIDYQIDDETIAILNYINRASEEDGNPNQNIVQIGLDRRIAPGQHIKAAVDFGVDGNESTPDISAKIQWSIEF
jgi:hypothetical protein